MKITWRTLLTIHVYAGLLCVPYLIIFSLSSLNFNHHFLSEAPLREEQQGSKQLDLSPQEDLEAFSEVILDSLGLFGWFLPWDSYQDSSLTHIEISHPGKRYEIEVNPKGKTQVSVKTESSAHLFKILHFLGEDIPHAPWWVNSWKYYQRLTVYAMLFWVVSGVYLWSRKKNRPKAESYSMWAVAILSLIFIALLWLNG